MDEPSDNRLVNPTAAVSTARPVSSSQAGSLLVAGSLIVRALAFLRLVGAARILNPEEIGRFAIVMTVLGVFESFAQPGLQTALVQRPGLRVRTVEAAWAVLIVRGCLLAAVTAALAPTIADLLGASASVALLQVAALVFVIRAFVSPALLMRIREVDLGPEVKTQALGAIVETAVALTLAIVWGSAWALLAGVLAGGIVEAAASFAVRGFTPRLVWDIGEVRPLLRVSRWLFASSALQYLSTAGDDLLVSRWVGLEPLGLYRVAYRVANLPTTEISHAVGRIALPAIARREEIERDVALLSFRRALVVVVGLAGGASAMIVGAASPLVSVSLGEEWTEATTALILLTVAGFIRAIMATAGSLFAGLGRPELATLMLATRAAVLFGGLAILLPPYGINGAATASLVSVAAMLPPWLWSLKAVGLGPLSVLGDVVRRLPVVVVTFAATVGLATTFKDPTAALPAAILAGGLTWLIATRAIDKAMWEDYRHRLSLVRARLDG